MDIQKAGLAGQELVRSGRRGGCSCCSLTFLGLFAVPMAALAALFFVL